MFRLQTWQLIVVLAVAVMCVGYMSVTIIRMMSRPAEGALVRPSTPLETGLVGAVPTANERAFDAFSYRVTARYAGRVRVVAREDSLTIAGPRAPRGLYVMWIWLQGIALALVPAVIALALVKLDWRALLLAVGVMLVSALFMAIGAGVWPGMGETLFVGEGRFDATEIELSAVRNVTLGEGWARDGMQLVIAPYVGGINQLAKGYAVSFNAPDGEGRDASYAVHLLTKEDASELYDLLSLGGGQ